MIKEDLVEYIKRQLSHGHNVTTIREHLLKHNYKEEIADEALHKAAELFGASIPKKKHYKKIAFILLALLAVGGIGFALFFMQSSDDLSGAASEPRPAIVIETPKQEIPQESKEEQLAEETTEESRELPEKEQPEEPAEEEQKEETAVEEPAPEEIIEEPVQAPEGCTGNSQCNAGYVCYNQICEIDNDRDLVSDKQEIEKGMNPLDQDSDDDGYFDYTEIDKETNPLDASSPGYTTCSKTTDCAMGSACSEIGVCTICSDSDELKYKTKGMGSGVHYVTSKAIFTQDSCADAGTLMEFYCTSDGYLYYKTVNCEQEQGTGYYCDSGRCVK